MDSKKNIQGIHEDKIGKAITKKRKNISLRHFLHAESLSFLHPTTMKRVKFFANLPKDLDDVLKGLKSL